eukprot:1136794-Pelagomonas_calceolata.AAC.2
MQDSLSEGSLSEGSLYAPARESRELHLRPSCRREGQASSLAATCAAPGSMHLNIGKRHER